MSWVGLAGVALAALFAGAINTVAGGGSLILFPVLVAAGLSPLSANVTNTVAVWPGYVGGVVGFADEVGQQRRQLRPLVVATVLGSSAGCALLLLTPSGAFDAVIPFLVLGASLLIGLQPRILRVVGRPSEQGRRIRIPLVFLACVYGGYFGGALGVVLLAVLALTLPGTLRRLTALKASLSLIDGTIGLIAFAFFGPVHWVVAAVAAPTALLGGYLGAGVAKRVSERALRWTVMALGIGAAIYLWVL